MVPLFVIDTHLCVPHNQHEVIAHLKDKYRRPNPKYAAASRMGYSTHGIDPFVEIYRDDPDFFRFPREAVHELPKSSVVEDRTSLGVPVNLGREVTLRDYQSEPVGKMLAELQHFKGGILQAAPGAGKTVAALEIARRLGRKTLVLVHTSFLMTQWRERVEQFLGVTCGTIQQDVLDTEHPIVVGMIQTVISRELPQEIRDQFGLVISDEAHRVSADTWKEAIVAFRSTYRLGVTATPERQDGLEWVFFSHIGPVSVVMELERETPEVYVIPSAIGPVLEPTNRMGKPDFVATVTLLTESHARNKQIVELVVDGAKNGRKIIVFSDRRKHLEDLAELFATRASEEGVHATFGFYVGGMTEAQRKIAGERQVIFSTLQFAKEGLDLAELDTCVLCTPKQDVIQAIGRIQRTLPNKPHPVVIDIADDDIGVCRGLLGKRLRQYRAQGWTVNDWRD